MKEAILIKLHTSIFHFYISSEVYLVDPTLEVREV